MAEERAASLRYIERLSGPKSILPPWFTPTPLEPRLAAHEGVSHAFCTYHVRGKPKNLSLPKAFETGHGEEP
jgi:hypothetical protein